MSVLQSIPPLLKSCGPCSALSAAERLRLLARMFTRPVFANIARSGDWLVALDFLVRHGVLVPASKEQSVFSLFEAAWHEIRSGYRNEFVYKAEIANRIVFGRHSPRTASLHVELPVGRSIVDLAVFNGTSTAYEIKTEFDSPRRLFTQTADYLMAFDRVCLVAHPLYVDKYIDMLDPRVGVFVLTERGVLRKVREPLDNASNVSPQVVFGCLQKAEYLAVIAKKTGHPVIKPTGVVQAYCSEVFQQFSALEAHDVFVRSLRKRKTDMGTVNFVGALPESLRVLGYATPLSKRQRETALSVLKGRVCFQIS